MAKITVQNLTKKFGEVTAVSDFSLEVDNRNFVVLLGPSGCGKTTILRCVAGLETPDRGDVYIGERNVTGLPPKDRNIAMVFQSYALYPHMSVYDNIAFPLKIRKKTKRDIEVAVKKVTDLLRIGHLLKRRPRQLSGGEQQRVALGRSLVREPSVFLMDEPLSNLDAKLRLYMRAELKRLQKELGITTVYVTHDQAEAMTMADKVAVVEKGVLQQYGPPDEIYNKPTSMSVAGFLGSPPMNFLECVLQSEGRLGGEGFSLEISRGLHELLKSRGGDGSFVLGIRPEDITLSQEPVANKKSVKSEVYVVEPMGATTIVDMRIGNEIYKVSIPRTFSAAIGEKMFMCFSEEDARFFDAKTKQNVA